MIALRNDLLVGILLSSLSLILLVYIGKKFIGQRGWPSSSEKGEKEVEKRKDEAGPSKQEEGENRKAEENEAGPSKQEEGENKKAEEDEAGPSTVPSKQGSFDFDVFISFRGKDTRCGFTSHLHKELTDRGISTFIDSENLEKGQKISELFKHIEESKIFVPVFSENYADSKWCLMEIAKIVEINKKAGRSRPIIPIFYKVDPFDVKHHGGSFEAAFATHQLNKLDLEKVNDWKAALTEAGKFSGYCLSEAQGITEAKLISIIGEKVSGILNKVAFHIDTVGIDSPVQHVMEMWEMKNDGGVSMIGIWGQGGMGKTTLAMSIYNKISSEYDGSCFLSDVRESAKQHKGLPALQEEFITEVLKEKRTIGTVEGGMSFLRQRLGDKRLLLVLDDVDDKKQLQAFTNDRVRGREAEWFGEGSKIIVTTRNKRVLLDHGLKEEETYELPQMDHYHSVQLFNRHAFVSSQQKATFGEFIEPAVEAAAGLPLALIVFGSFFRGTKGKREWQTKLEELKRVQDKDVYDKLKISYDSLDPREKCIFLDIACLLIRHNKEYPVYMWDSYGYFPDIRLEVLQHKSLVKINKYGVFEMHDQIRDMGRRIIIEEGNFEPTKYSRLWDKDDISQVLNAAEVSSGNHHLRGFDMRGVDYRQRLSWNTIAAMPNLQMIYNPSRFRFQEGEMRLAGNTRWLHWRYCPMKTLSFYNNQHEQLVVLDLSLGDFRELRSRNMAFPKLKVLDFSSCPYLIHTPDFTHLPCLEKLQLDYCYSLAEIDESIGHAKKLIHLSMSVCESLKGLPTSLCELTSLEILNVEGCHNVKSLPIQVGNLKSLRYLDLASTSLTEIPDSIGGLESLEELKLSFCNGISFLPKQIGDLKLLRLLNLARTSITEIPDSIGGLESLEELKLSFCNGISFLPKQIGDLKLLRLLDLARTSITEIPDSIGGLESLEELKLGFCNEFFFLPKQIGDLKLLRLLDLERTSITEIPDSIGGLESLEELKLNFCNGISFLPKQIGNLKSLRYLGLQETSMTEIPDSIGGLESLEKLDLEGCSSLRRLPDSIGGLKSLSQLILGKCSTLEQLSDSIEMLTSLITLDLSGCELLREIPDSVGGLQNLSQVFLHSQMEPLKKVPNSIREWEPLESVCLDDFKSLERLPDFLGDLKSVQNLSLRRCQSVQEIPEFICRLESLRDLDLRGCTSLKKIPESIGSLTGLSSLCLMHCQSLEELPESIGSLQCLSELHISGSMKLQKVPNFIGKLKNLRKLHLRDIVEIPDLITGLLQLETLSVKVCPELKSLPQLPSSLENLQVISCDALKELPNLSNLKDLTELLLGGCGGLNDLPGLENLKSLGQLGLINCDNLGCDLMSKLSKASFEKLVGFLISGAIVGSNLLFGFPKGNISYLQGLICLTEESHVDSTIGINIHIQVLADGKIIYEGSREAYKIEDSEKGEDSDIAYCLGLKGKVMYHIEFEKDDDIRKYVREGQVMVRVPTIYDGYQLNMGYFGY